MANYDNLPVFKSTYDLLLHLFQLGQHWNRDIRFTLGENLKKELISLLTFIYQANANHQKRDYLKKARSSIVVVKLQIRLLYDLKQLSLKQFAHICEKTDSVSKQLSAWDKYHNNESQISSLPDQSSP